MFPHAVAVVAADAIHDVIARAVEHPTLGDERWRDVVARDAQLEPAIPAVVAAAARRFDDELATRRDLRSHSAIRREAPRRSLLADVRERARDLGAEAQGGVEGDGHGSRGDTHADAILAARRARPGERSRDRPLGDRAQRDRGRLDTRERQRFDLAHHLGATIVDALGLAGPGDERSGEQRRERAAERGRGSAAAVGVRSFHPTILPCGRNSDVVQVPPFRWRTSMTERHQALRGTHDILPDEIPRWEFLERTARSVFERHGFREIRTPILEATPLFVRSVGASSDIVRKEMYTIERGDDSMTLRPEGTAPVVRAFVEHALYRDVALGFPERYFYMGAMFRHERPQKGRQRQFHQIGAEVLGSADPRADAETIQLVELLLDELGIRERELVLGSVGDPTCREPYRARLRAWLDPRLPTMCEDCRRRADENPLRVFDCKVEHDRRVLSEAPALLDGLCGACAEHFAAVRGVLDAAGVSYRIDPRIVRGLDYYRRTVFETLAVRLGAQNAILGGGRYDGLVEQLGGPALPGFGFAMGMERAVLLLDAARVPVARADAILVPLGAEGLAPAHALAARLRRAGCAVLTTLVERPLGAQMKRADRARTRFAVFVGPDEIARGTYGVKDLASGVQESLDERQLLERLGGRA